MLTENFEINNCIVSYAEDDADILLVETALEEPRLSLEKMLIFL